MIIKFMCLVNTWEPMGAAEDLWSVQSFTLMPKWGKVKVATGILCSFFGTCFFCLVGKSSFFFAVLLVLVYQCFVTNKETMWKMLIKCGAVVS